MLLSVISLITNSKALLGLFFSIFFRSIRMLSISTKIPQVQLSTALPIHEYLTNVCIEIVMDI